MAFVDTSFWFARAIARDRRHPDAVALADRLRGERVTTSNVVLGETWTLLSARAGHHRALQWLDSVRGDLRVVVERLDRDLEEDAWAWLRGHDERPYSFVDATSFALMR
ncbi:MAG TPA: PIN domain-containing protein, partial [Gaiellaceae bacterium]|nr:PIN domain-containing protein [Gaiellaceae bacterium]